jgi:hypothetical protein
LFPKVPNTYFPEIYSIQGNKMLQTAWNTTNPCVVFHKVTTYADELEHELINNWCAVRLNELVWRDSAVQVRVNRFLTEHWNQLRFRVHDVVSKETYILSDMTPEEKCRTCHDTALHNDGKCVSLAGASPQFSRALEGLRAQDFMLVAGIWVGTHLHHSMWTPHCTRYHILNLTCKKEIFRVANGVSLGQKVILKTKGVHVTRFNSYFDYLAEVCATLPTNYNMPIFVNLVLEADQVDNMERLISSVGAFVAQLDSLRAKYSISPTLIGALPRFVNRMDAVVYKAELRKLAIINNVASIMCGRANLIFVPTHGWATSAFDLHTGSGAWSDVSTMEGFFDEKLFNLTGSATRELRRRLGYMVEKIIEAYIDVNNHAPFFNVHRRNLVFRDPRFYFRGGQ